MKTLTIIVGIILLLAIGDYIYQKIDRQWKDRVIARLKARETPPLKYLEFPQPRQGATLFPLQGCYNLKSLTFPTDLRGIKYLRIHIVSAHKTTGFIQVSGRFIEQRKSVITTQFDCIQSLR